MLDRSIFRRLLLGFSTGLALAVAGVAVPIIVGAPTPAMAQSADDMAAALDAYGHWVSRAPYGEVWVPDGVPRDWRPYEYGHWVYTDDWGWYWVSDDAEDDWGWVVYHYGRWAHDRRIGWFWVPGDEWAPAWVDWRYGDDDIGWSPLPPDDMIDAYDSEPDYWVFVPLRYIGESELRRHYVPLGRRAAVLRETHIINRPVHIEGRRLWVNPGLAPGFIAARTHVALHAYKRAPARVRRHYRRAGRGDRAQGRPAHQGCNQTCCADHRAALDYGDYADNGRARAESAQQGRARTTRQPPATRRARCGDADAAGSRSAAAERTGDHPAKRSGSLGHAQRDAESNDSGTA